MGADEVAAAVGGSRAGGVGTESGGTGARECAPGGVTPASAVRRSRSAASAAATALGRGAGDTGSPVGGGSDGRVTGDVKPNCVGAREGSGTGAPGTVLPVPLRGGTVAGDRRCSRTIGAACDGRAVPGSPNAASPVGGSSGRGGDELWAGEAGGAATTAIPSWVAWRDGTRATVEVRGRASTSRSVACSSALAGAWGSGATAAYCASLTGGSNCAGFPCAPAPSAASAPQSPSISSVGGGIDGMTKERPASGSSSPSARGEGSSGEDPPLVRVIVRPRLSHPTRAVKTGTWRQSRQPPTSASRVLASSCSGFSTSALVARTLALRTSPSLNASQARQYCASALVAGVMPSPVAGS